MSPSAINIAVLGLGYRKALVGAVFLLFMNGLRKQCICDNDNGWFRNLCTQTIIPSHSVLSLAYASAEAQ